MTLGGLVREKRGEILSLASRRGLSNVRVFGSVARGEEDHLSDLDLLVDLPPNGSLLDLGGFYMDLKDLLGVEVDVVTVAGLRPRVRERALREAVPL